MIWGNTPEQYLTFIGLAVLGVLVGKILYFFLGKVVKRLTAKTKTEIDDIIIDVVEEPLVFLIVIACFYLGFLQLHLPPNIEHIIFQGLKLLLMIAGFWFIIRLFDRVFIQLVSPLIQKTETDLDDLVVPVLQKIIRIVLIIVAILTIIGNFGYNIGSLIAGLGIGGLAFALAAKDLLGNLFSGISLIADAPFRVGDNINFEGKEGVVLSIGLRSSCVETLDGPILTVPNALLANGIIINKGTWERFRVKMIIALTYDTSAAKMERAMKIIKEILDGRKELDKPLTRIHFTDFGAYSLNIQVIYLIKDIENILPIRDAINMKIKERFDKEKIKFAFPTQTIEYKKVQ